MHTARLCACTLLYCQGPHHVLVCPALTSLLAYAILAMHRTAGVQADNRTLLPGLVPHELISFNL